MQMPCDSTQVVTVFAQRYSSLQCRLISMVLIGIRQSPILGFFKSAPEVRVLCSAGITQHRHVGDMLRMYAPMTLSDSRQDRRLKRR